MPVQFDPEKVVAEYRKAIRYRDRLTTEGGKARFEGIAVRLRRAWKEWQGEDSLHEMAFGEPIE